MFCSEIVTSFKSPQFLAIGISTGVLAVYSVTVTDSFCEELSPVISFTAHPPQEENIDLRFGQLSKQYVLFRLSMDIQDMYK